MMRNRWLVVLAIIVAFSAVTAAGTKKDGRKTRRETTVSSALQSVMNFDEARHKQQVDSIIEETERYTGTHVSVGESSKNVPAHQLKLITALMANADIQPPDRLQRFSWMPEQQQTKITGWNAKIIEAAPTDGGILVTFMVTPLHAGNAGLMTTDYALETYLITDSGVQLLQIGFPPHRGAVSFN